MYIHVHIHVAAKATNWYTCYDAHSRVLWPTQTYLTGAHIPSSPPPHQRKAGAQGGGGNGAQWQVSTGTCMHICMDKWGELFASSDHMHQFMFFPESESEDSTMLGVLQSIQRGQVLLLEEIKKAFGTVQPQQSTPNPNYAPLTVTLPQANYGTPQPECSTPQPEYTSIYSTDDIGY